MVVDDEGEVRAMLTRFDQIPLFSTDALEPNGAYQVRVNLEMRPRKRVVRLAVDTLGGLRLDALYLSPVAAPYVNRTTPHGKRVRTRCSARLEPVDGACSPRRIGTAAP